MSLIGGAVVSILVDLAIKVGAKQVAKHLGPEAGEIAGTIVEAIADKAGVPAEQLPEVPHKELEQAIKEVEPMTADLVIAYTAQLAEQNRLSIAELELVKEGKAPAWTANWRPFSMWVLILLVVWYVAGVPVINVILRLVGASDQVTLIVDAGTFFAIFATYSGLYMGGHTVKDGVGKVMEYLKEKKPQ
jgi:antitoxin component of RelBE/YafQ-DinJ toxin-antitoxin module